MADLGIFFLSGLDSSLVALFFPFSLSRVPHRCTFSSRILSDQNLYSFPARPYTHILAHTRHRNPFHATLIQSPIHSFIQPASHKESKPTQNYTCTTESSCCLYHASLLHFLLQFFLSLFSTLSSSLFFSHLFFFAVFSLFASCFVLCHI